MIYIEIEIQNGEKNCENHQYRPVLGVYVKNF